MPKFNILQADPDKYRDKIYQFWRDYLPGTPEGRLDWMAKNPAGPAIWFFAIEENTGEVAGTISLFPKDLFVDGKQIKAAILGDLMIQSKFKVFGPTLRLIKAAKSYKETGKFDFFYTIPNLNSKKFVEKAGFGSVGKCYSLICPQKCDTLLRKYIGSFASKMLEWPLLSALKLFSQTTYTLGQGEVEITEWEDTAFKVFSQKFDNCSSDRMTGDHNLSYLDWRYRQNPEYDFQLITYKDYHGGDIRGFIVFALDNLRLELFDMVALEKKMIPKMLKKLISISKNENCHGIYSLIYQNNPLLPNLKRCCFFDTKDQVEIYAYPEDFHDIKKWGFTSADRNI